MAEAGTPDAARIARASCSASRAARAFTVPDGTSMMIPPVDSRRHA